MRPRGQELVIKKAEERRRRRREKVEGKEKKKDIEFDINKKQAEFSKKEGY